jgi:predicted transcriptional regulator
MPIRGPELRAERRAAEVTVVDIAARMGLSRQSVHVLEGSAIVSIERVEQYRKALADAIETARRGVA